MEFSSFFPSIDVLHTHNVNRFRNGLLGGKLLNVSTFILNGLNGEPLGQSVEHILDAPVDKLDDPDNPIDYIDKGPKDDNKHDDNTNDNHSRLSILKFLNIWQQFQNVQGHETEMIHQP